MTLNILGLDISTHCGYAFGTGGGELNYVRGVMTFKPHPTHRFIRWNDYVVKLNSLLKTFPVDVCCIEGYGYANSRTLVPLVELGTLLREELNRHKIPWFEVPPTTLKMFVTGSGNSKKQQMMLALYVHWGVEIKDDNMADAQALAYFAQALFGGRKALPAKNYVPVIKYRKAHAEFLQPLQNLIDKLKQTC